MIRYMISYNIIINYIILARSICKPTNKHLAQNILKHRSAVPNLS